MTDRVFEDGLNGAGLWFEVRPDEFFPVYRYQGWEEADARWSGVPGAPLKLVRKQFGPLQERTADYPRPVDNGSDT